MTTVTDFTKSTVAFPTEAKPAHHITIHIKVFSTKDDIDTELTEIENKIEELFLSQSKENGFLSFDIWSVDNMVR